MGSPMLEPTKIIFCSNFWYQTAHCCILEFRMIQKLQGKWRLHQFFLSSIWCETLFSCTRRTPTTYLHNCDDICTRKLVTWKCCLVKHHQEHCSKPQASDQSVQQLCKVIRLCQKKPFERKNTLRMYVLRMYMFPISFLVLKLQLVLFSVDDIHRTFLLNHSFLTHLRTLIEKP